MRRARRSIGTQFTGCTGTKVHMLTLISRRAMHHAAITGDAHTAEALIAAGADLNSENEDKMTALSYAACQNDDGRVLNFLIAAKADFASILYYYLCLKLKGVQFWNDQ